MKKIFTFSCLLAMLWCMTGCEAFGLDLQEPYDYDSEKGKYDNRVNQTVWDFMNSRTDLFSDMLDAIAYAGIDPSFYQQENCTYLLLTNQSLTSDTESNRSYFYEHRVFENPDDTEVFTLPASWEEMPREEVKQMLMYHVIKGYQLSYDELTVMTKGENNFFPTCNEAYPMAVEMQKEGALSIYFNNFDNHYVAKLKPRTSNLFSVDSKSYMHVMDNYVQYPDQFALSTIPFYESK